MKRALTLVLLGAFLLAACAAPVSPTATAVPATEAPTQAPTVAARAAPAPRTLTVFAAASLTGSFGEITKSFEATNPGVTVNTNFAGSQALRTQIEQGASADVFASADHKNMDTMVTENLIADGKYQDFATNRLVVILPSNNPAGIQTLQDLAKPGIKLDLADASVPVGNYARQALASMSQDGAFGGDFSNKALANVVSNETDVKQVVSKVDLGEVDAGIVYVTDAQAAPDLKTVAIPDNFNVIAKYPIAVVAKAPNADLAAAFVAYVFSPDGQAVLQKWGFAPAK
jgi:molybdate transport system substrate-binding protein